MCASVHLYVCVRTYMCVHACIAFVYSQCPWQVCPGKVDTSERWHCRSATSPTHCNAASVHYLHWCTHTTWQPCVCHSTNLPTACVRLRHFLPVYNIKVHCFLCRRTRRDFLCFLAAHNIKLTTPLPVPHTKSKFTAHWISHTPSL